MRTIVRLSLVALLAAFLSMPADAAGVCRFTPPTSAGRASNVLDRLIGLTTDQRGIGGTGVVAQREERGLGGTGIVGMVTGFGSICVNGFEVELPRTTPVSVAGLPAAAGDLRLGQVVVLEANSDAAGLLATRVNVTVAVAGPVSAIADDRATLTVAGQTVAVAGFGGSAGANNLRPGDWVVVSGLRRDDDSIAGSSIVKLPRRGREVFLSGTTRAVPGAVEIGALVIASPVITAGEAVSVRGTISGTTLQALTVDVEAASPFTRPMASVSVQGYGAHVESELQRLGITPPTVAPAAPVQVDGTFGAGGAFTPSRVAPPAPPVNGAVPVQGQRPLNDAPVTAPVRPAAPPARPAPPPDVQRPPTLDIQRPAPPVRPPPPPERPAPRPE